MNSATTTTHSGKVQPFVQNIAKIGDSSIKKIDEIRKFEVARVIDQFEFFSRNFDFAAVCKLYHYHHHHNIVSHVACGTI